MDIVTDTSFLTKVIGKYIKVTAINGCFQGVLLSIHASRTITLIKVKDVATGKAVPGTKILFGHTILKVEPQEEPSGLSSQEPEDLTVNERDNSLSQESDKYAGEQAMEIKETETSAPHEMHASIIQAIKRAVEDEAVNYIVIDQFQPMLGPAIRHLQSQKVLSLGAVGLNLYRHGKLCWLQVATKTCVYLFDILLLGPGVFRNGLQMVLEDKSILKVVHDCRWLGEVLSHQYSVVLSNVFDTQVGDVYLFFMETGGFLPNRTCSVKECLTRHLNMPSSQISFLTYKQTLIKDNPNIWLDRPMPTHLLKVLALEVMHLLALRLAMLDAMLADFTLLVDGYLNTYCQGTADALGSTEICSELPKELQQLSVLQQVRREKALHEFIVSDQGFLTRD
ncbi:piRNA biogenesis protein EXD1 [Pseudophryne corroboree]|uniref:piRNA biogenesis protein EXD1 n=1 Tax=Pseudophryne corroboree TaxID=495146 RepID=UPI00308183D7